MSTFLETGVFQGVNVRFQSRYWKEVLSCDIVAEYVEDAKNYVKDCKNVFIKNVSSDIFLKEFIKRYNEEKRTDTVFMYLDAHFYNPNHYIEEVSEEDNWVIIKELQALEDFSNCVILVHDFDCSGLGHCCFDGAPLGFPLILEHLRKINPNFYFYVNTKEFCDIYDIGSVKGNKDVLIDKRTMRVVKQSNSSDRLRYRGILYCTPTKLNLSNFKLVRA